MSVSLGEVEAFVAACRERLEADRRELQDEQERTCALYQQVQNYAQEEKENSPVLYTGAESRPTSSRSTVREENFPSHLSSLFGEEEEFFPFKEDEGRRRRLAQERQHEYNTFLRRKEETEAARKKVAEEKVAPRSILESVDYDKVLARMKAQEAQFRNVNRAEPSLEESSSSIHFSPAQKYTPEQKKSASVVSNGIEPYHTNKYLVERDKDFSRPQSSDRKVFHAPTSTSTISKSVETRLPNNPTPKRQNDTSRPESSGKKTYQSPVGFSEHQRRGGGGDPLRDSNGNLITTRGYLSFPSQQQNLHRNQQMFYREQLQQQIEERRALEAEERRRLREEEEALARRAEEQRLRMLREYEEEQARSLRKNEQRESERLRQLEEYKLREAALRQKRAPPPPVPEVPVPMEPERPKSPPIPAVRSKTILNNTPPILVDVKPENVFSSLSEIRRSLMQEQPQKDFKNSYEVMNRRTVLDDDEELE